MLDRTWCVRKIGLIATQRLELAPNRKYYKREEMAKREYHNLRGWLHDNFTLYMRGSWAQRPNNKAKCQTIAVLVSYANVKSDTTTEDESEEPRNVTHKFETNSFNESDDLADSW
jgi:hypothetical protein